MLLLNQLVQKHKPAVRSARSCSDVNAASLMKFSIQVKLFLKNKLDMVLYPSSTVDCVFNILCNYHSQTIGGILPVIFWLVPL